MDSHLCIGTCTCTRLAGTPRIPRLFTNTSPIATPPPPHTQKLPNIHSGATALHFAAAAKANSAAVCEALLAAGASTEATDRAGCQPYERTDDPALRRRLGGPDPRLFELAAAGDAEGLKALILSGAIPTVRSIDPDGRHALTIAAGSGKGAAAVRLLLEVDPALAAIPDLTGHCALHRAAEAGDADAARALIAVLDKAQVDQRSLFLSEYSQGDWLSARDKAAIEPWDKTALMVAVDAGDAEMASLLLSAGADPKVPDFDGGCALHSAAAQQDEELVEMLLEAGAE